MANRNKKREKPSVIPIKDDDIGKTVWVACRQGCGHNQATVVLKLRIAEGGTRIRYQCQGCQKFSGITV
jgi:hypothetical protein